MLRPASSKGVEDPVPDPEPASPSLPGPDPGVFQHEPGEPDAGDPGAGEKEQATAKANAGASPLRHSR